MGLAYDLFYVLRNHTTLLTIINYQVRNTV